jgi:hypothetical protein
MSLPSPIRRLLVGAFLLPIALSGGCKDQRGEVAGPNYGFLDPDSVFFTAMVSLSLYNYTNLVADEVFEIILAGGTNQPIFTESCTSGGGERIIVQDDSTFTVTHLSPGFVIFASPFFFETCGGFLRVTVNREMTITFHTIPDTSDALPDSLRYTITLPDDGTATPGVGYTLPPQFGGTVLATTGRIHCELVDIVHDGAGRIVSGFLSQTGTMRLENRADFFLLVEELDLLYEWPWPVLRNDCSDDAPPLEFAPFPHGLYEIAGFTTGFTGPLTGFPLEVEFDGCSTGEFTANGQTCTVDLVNCTSPCGTVRNCNDVF